MKNKFFNEKEIQQRLKGASDYMPKSVLQYGATVEELSTFPSRAEDGTRLLMPIRSYKEKLLNTLQNFFLFKNQIAGTHLLVQTIKTPLRWTALLLWLRKEGVPCNIHEPLYQRVSNDVPKRFLANVYAEELGDFSDGVRLDINQHGFGVSDNPDISASKAVGEFLERYYFTVYRRKNLHYATAKELSKKRKKYINVAEVDFFTEKQKNIFPKRFSNAYEKSLGWVEGVSLTCEKKVFIPAQLIFWNYNRQYDGYEEPMLYEQNTNGEAAHFTKEAAILAGLREVIERDAFLVHWLKNIPPPRIAHSSIHNKEIQNILNEFKQFEYQIELCDVTIDTHQHVIVAVAIDRSRIGPAVMMGASCRAHIHDAIYDALQEVLVTCIAQRDWIEEKYRLPDTYTPFFDGRITRIERMKLASNSEYFSKYAWFVEGEEYQLRGDTQEQIRESAIETLSKLVKKFKEDGRDVFYYEINDKVLKKLKYHAVKVVVPKLFPMYLNETSACLGHPRLHNDLPLKYDRYRENLINQHPHPFP